MAFGLGRGARERPRGSPPAAVVGVIAVLAVFATDARGQGLPPRYIDQLEVGDSVRLRVTGALPLDGALRAVRGDTLVLRVVGIDDPWPVSSTDLVTLERYTERNSREGFRHGAMTGLVIGFFAGAAVGIAVETRHSHDNTELTAAMISSALRWGGGGAGIGAATGAIWGGAHPGRGWVGLSLPTR